MVKECLFFLTSFFFIRKFSGGLHLNKYVSCFFASEVLIVGSLVLLRLLIKNDCNVLIFIFLIIISSILLLLLSPVKNNNKKISKSQKYFFKTMILILTTINLIIVIYLINVNKNAGYNNKNKIPNGCEITLLDMSEGMLRAAKDNIGEIDNVKFNYINGDVQNLKFDDYAFDIVIANHMLYHVDDIIKALNELKRVLKIDGTIYASTFSLLHMKELNDLLFTFIPNKLPNTSDRFCLENGAYYMLNVFENVKLKRHFDCLKVKSADDLMAYLLSRTKVKKQLDKNMINSIFDIINKTIEKEGYFYIRKDAILFLCNREN